MLDTTTFTILRCKTFEKRGEKKKTFSTIAYFIPNDLKEKVKFSVEVRQSSAPKCAKTKKNQK